MTYHFVSPEICAGPAKNEVSQACAMGTNHNFGLMKKADLILKGEIL
jgi:hypothetical protein